MHHLFLSLIFLFPFLANAQQKLSNKQERWLYRLVEKTPVLQRNWQTYFEFDKTPFYKQINGVLKPDYQAILYFQKHQPNSLVIQYDSLKTSSNGLLSEAAIKLTLWELNEELKHYIYTPSHSNDSLLTYFEKPLQKLIPSGIKDKKHADILKTVMHPSLPMAKKIEALNDHHKLSVSAQKNLLNKWSNLVATYSHRRSQYFFNILSGGQQLSSTTFLAAGEGSGTAGLLYELELNPEDSTQTWYGKGIGLFTYQLRAHKNQLHLRTHTNQTITIPPHQTMALHASLWGLNSSFKPMLIISDDSVSYHLFADFSTKELSADGHIGTGISHIDRIEQYREKKIQTPLKELQNDGALITNLNKAYASKQIIADHLTALESEIDTLRKYDPENEPAIKHRKNQIETNLRNLSKKEQRIKELEQKLSLKNTNIHKAEKKLASMIELLGPNPQKWQKEKRKYIYDSGVVFDASSQDLIFPASDQSRALNVRLLSASYTLEGKQKDEVQAYVCLSKTKSAPTTSTKDLKTKLDTSFTLFFHPDEYIAYTPLIINTALKSKLKQYKTVQYKIAHLALPDSLNSKNTHYKNRTREYELPLTIDAKNRKAILSLQSTGDTLLISSYACSDSVPTRLSKVPKELRQALNSFSPSNKNNTYLQAMRAVAVLIQLDHQIELSIDIDQVKNEMNILPNELNLMVNYLKNE